MAKAAQVPATVTNKNEVAPSFMQEDINRGKENITSEDFEIPRLKILQSVSPELEEYNKARPGNFLHLGAEFLFDKPFLVVPIMFERRFLLWRPREDGGGILARSDDGVHLVPGNAEFTVKLDKKDGGRTVTWKTAPTVEQSGLAEWGTMNPEDTSSPPALTRMLSFLLAFPEYPEVGPAVFTFQRSSIKVGRKLLTRIKTIRAPIFGMQFEFSAVSDQNANGDKFFNVATKGMGLVTDEKLYQQYKALHDSFQKTGLKIKDEGDLQNEVSGTADDDEKDAGDTAPGKKGTTGRPRY